MKKVITFGAFDIVHPGHKHYLLEAKKYGDQLITIVARDINVLKIKGKKPLYSEQKRLKDIKKIGISDIVELGHKTDVLFAVKKHKPDIIVLGYDQDSFIHLLSEYLYKNNIKTSIVTVLPYKKEKYKSSIIKNKTKKI